ncbi:MAG: hypothetical protein Q7R72_00030, partial [bacterium]|nr:hypothetical protein [bacterium]
MKINFIKNRNKGGYALITALIFFLTATSAVIAGISDAVFREVRTIRNESLSKQSYFTSESAVEDATYRIKTAKSLDSTESLTLATSTASVTVSTLGDGSREIVSMADANGTQRNTTLILNQGNAVSFIYAMHGGVEGIDMSGGSVITGDIYTNGSIRGCGSCTVSGQATAAGKSSSSLDQNNSVPTTPTQSIIFGNTT